MLLKQNKCARYWPDEGETKECGSIRLGLLSETDCIDYTLRVISATKFKQSYIPPLSPSSVIKSTASGIMSTTKGLLGKKLSPKSPDERASSPSTNQEPFKEETRTIYQYHFTAWPDHGVPSDPGCVLNFLQEVNTRQEQVHPVGPVVVHCRYVSNSFFDVGYNVS